MLQVAGNEQIHDTVESLMGKYGKKEVKSYLDNLQMNPTDLKMGKSKPETINAYTLKVAAKLYDTTPAQILNTKGNHHISEARMICVAILRKHSPLSLNEIADLYNLAARSYVHKLVKNMEDILETPQYNKELCKKYEIIAGQVKAYMEAFGKETTVDQTRSNKPVAASLTQAAMAQPIEHRIIQNSSRSSNIEQVLATNANIDAALASSDTLNFTGDEVDTSLGNESPEASVDFSPFNEPVIERNNNDGISKLMNNTNLVEDAKVVETPIDQTRSNNATAPASEEGFAPGEINVDALADEFAGSEQSSNNAAQGAPSSTSYNEPPAFTINPTSTSEGAGQAEGYQMPPEASEALNKFSTNTIMGMAEAMLPRITFSFVEINEREAGRIMENEDAVIRKRVANDIKQMNRENLQTLDKEVRTILPYMREPLSNLVTAERLRVSPGLALAVYGIWLVVVLFIAMNRMAGERKKLMEDLRAYRDEKKPL
ncbi:hypothetical protein Q0590_24800 [Rhodocytophaga aerolata]|uniref:Chromosomal replication initiator DnaA C-terminal domain-containing protein n=1 Tax=Rhodocytophaga aerolata TaxID=455078 RepID=A0ABT8RBP6_9BACT|nr:hypothetical protein [Rhodocytophaga aerolata]MDO1449519.1 hypothetical protein [Rhodocytophaga aerolata]